MSFCGGSWMGGPSGAPMLTEVHHVVVEVCLAMKIVCLAMQPKMCDESMFLQLQPT